MEIIEKDSSKQNHFQRIIFLCTGNSARNQMAEALLKHLGGSMFEVQSAGTNASFQHISL